METEADKIERNKHYTKRVKVRINRTGRDAMISAKYDVIDGGAGDEFIKIRPGDEVIIKEKFLYCFTDAVIEKEMFERDQEGQITRKWKEYTPRFEVRILGYYVSDERFVKESVASKLYPITEEQFRDPKFDMEAYVREAGEREQAYKEFKERQSDQRAEAESPSAAV